MDDPFSDLIKDIAYLKRGEVAVEQQLGAIRKDIEEVADGCERFRNDVRKQWDTDRKERDARAKEKAASRERNKASSKLVAIAVIGACATVLASMIAAAAVIITGAP